MKCGELVDWTLYFAMRGMPMTACSNLGAWLSPYLAKRPNPEEHRNARALFAELKPDWARDERALDAAVDRLWANVARTYAEFAVSHRMLRAGRVAIEGRGYLDEALASRRPIVAIFPHLGNWELSEMQFGFLAPHRGAVIVAPPGRGSRALIAESVRRKVPADLLPMSKTVWRQALAKLKTPGGGIMLAIDEQQTDGQTLSPTSGAGNLGKAARLALLTNAIIVPFYNERLPQTRFITHFLPPFELSGQSHDPEAVHEAVNRLDAVMREPILRLLDQWYMALFVPPSHAGSQEENCLRAAGPARLPREVKM